MRRRAVLPALLLAAFLVRPPPAAADPSVPRWRDFEIVMWQPRTSAQYAALKAIGVTAGAMVIDRDHPADLPKAQADALIATDLRWYAENTATDFYAAYHRWFPERPVNWRFEAAKTLYRDNPNGIAAFLRDPSLSDPAALRTIEDRLTAVVRAHRAYRPLFYDLGDETGIGDLSIPWDFDFSAPSLAGLRQWLRQRYGSLTALNAQWGSAFSDWDAVMPMTTREAFARTDENYSGWADFKEWMDEAFARALRRGTDAVHAADGHALAAIDGAQIPGWGGYDYTRLARAVDVMELYDGGGNWEIVRSLNPAMIMLTPSPASGPEETHAIWRTALRGGRGVILWDPRNEIVGENGALGERGRNAARVFAELRGGLGALLVGSARHYDPVAILYSPASLRLQWLLDWRSRGEAWALRDTRDSYEDANAVRTSLTDDIERLEALAIHPRIVSPDQVTRGALQSDGVRVLVLPRVLALSPEEAAAIRRFAASGGTVIADVEPGMFDAHGRKRAVPALRDLFRHPGDVKNAARILAPDDAGLAAVLAANGVRPALAISEPSSALAAIESHLFRHGDALILALQQKWTGATGEVRTVRVNLPGPAVVYDLRAGRALGRQTRLDVNLPAVEPAILSLSPTPLPAPTLRMPHRARLGESVTVRAGVAGPSDILHADIVDPKGDIAVEKSSTLFAVDGKAALTIAFAPDDAPGRWSIRLKDVLGGESVNGTLDVAPR
ncbi:MAG TPA: alpha-amylase family protein [Stellaceae bacterium]|nr:alpha-amylase family protein [Stellaceae bacterium]